MTFFVPAIFFVLGAIFASFAGVVTGRLHTGQSIIRGRSRCDACNHELGVLELVPIVSYVMYRGRAACCGARISPLSTLTEILLGVLMVLAYLKLGITPALIAALVTLVLLQALVIYDLLHQILPFVLLVPFVVAAVITDVLSSSTQELFSHTCVAAALAATLLILHYGSRGRAMGFADAPFTLGLAFVAGANALSGFVYSFWIGAVVGIIVLLRRPAGSRMGVEVPFAPFLAAGFLLAYFTQWNIFALTALFGF